MLSDQERDQVRAGREHLEAATRHVQACLHSLDSALATSEEDDNLCADALLSAEEHHSIAHWYVGVGARIALAPVMQRHGIGEV